MSAEQLQFTFIQVTQGVPTIRWLRVAMFIVAGVASYLLAQTVLYLVLQVPFRLGIISAMLFVHLAVFSTAVELQRQSILAGKWVFRFDLRYLLLVTLFIALFLSSIVAEVQASQRSMQRNSELTKLLEDQIAGGVVSIGGQHGRQISCVVTRTDFSDNDLSKLIASTTNEAGVCEITMLQLEATAVTDVGLQQLAGCSNLEFVSLPAISLSDTTFEVLASCRKLNHLLFDTRKQDPTQIIGLSVRLPNTRINGVLRSER